MLSNNGNIKDKNYKIQKDSFPCNKDSEISSNKNSNAYENYLNPKFIKKDFKGDDKSVSRNLGKNENSKNFQSNMKSFTTVSVCAKPLRIEPTIFFSVSVKFCFQSLTSLIIGTSVCSQWACCCLSQ